VLDFPVKVWAYSDVEGVSLSLFATEPYLNVYGLSEAPYSTKPNERYLYLTPTHQEAIAMVAKVISRIC
jgi:type II secretory pathway predicted ATPase ExeA